jgi:glycosyltransferase involved in cell wall biosynthesis
MNIGFEAKRFFTNMTGLGNYSRFIVDALSTFEDHNSYYLYTPRATTHQEVVKILNHDNISVFTPGKFYRASKTTSLWRSWGVSRDESISRLDIFHGLSQELPAGLPKRIKKIVTVHDLIFFRYPQFYNPIDVSIYKYKLANACRKADKIIAISKQTAEDLVDFLKVDPWKIEIVYQGCQPNFKQKLTDHQRAEIKIKYNLPDKYILNVGTIEERKNLMLVVKALASMPRHARLPLMVLGKKTKYYEKVVHEAGKLGVLDKITFLHNASFADFPGIYQNATVFVYPSLFEGFGIPLVEAIESGIPVITSKGSCFSEAAGPSSIYIDPQNTEDLASQLYNVISDADLREKMVEQSFYYIAKFQPQAIAADLMKLYKSF